MTEGASLFDRTISGFPLSVGTGLAMESIFNPQFVPIDPDRNAPPKVKLEDYTEIWINVHTLVRNIAAAADKFVLKTATTQEFLSVLVSEMDVIKTLFAVEGMGRCVPVFYISSYDSVYKGKISKYVKGREDGSEFGRRLANIMHDIEKNLKRVRLDSIRTFDLELKPTNMLTSAIIITSNPVDLVSYKNFRRLDLLESHTGKLKPRTQWSSKYHPLGNSDMSRLPWHPKLHWVFGDRSVVQPMDIKIRKAVYSLAEQCGWHAATTIAKVNQDIQLFVKEPMLQQMLLGLSN